MKKPEPDLVLFHWSPLERRASIQKRGLCPGSKARGDYKWRPPFICMSEDPVLAWHLSGRLDPAIDAWDLWQVLAYELNGYEMILDTFVNTGRHYIKEFRIYERIPKRNVRYVASRKQKAPR